MKRTIRRLGVVALALTAVLLVTQCTLRLPGGTRVTGSRGEINLKSLIEERHPDNVQVIAVERLDVDGDEELEWLVLYRFDPTQGGNFGIAPAQGLLYDVVTCEFPEFVTYTLPTPANDYLAEGSVSISLNDFLDNTEDPYSAPQETIIRGEGPRKTLAVFRFRDEVRNPCVAPSTPREGFYSVGYFSANLRIERDGKAITLWDRTAFERSQLAIRRLYRPTNGPRGETYVDENGNLLPPVEQSVDFAYGLPENPSDSPYPEKAVAAFYLYLGTDTKEKARAFLMPELQGQFPEGRFGLPVPVTRVERVFIHSVTYYPDAQKERAREDQEVTITVQAVPTGGGDAAGATCTVRWLVRNFEHPVEGTPTLAQRGDREWRLAQIQSVSGDAGCGP
ncbi:MAG: hypothetical protein Q9O62_14640 [Ardenticatenia bacterium]|nr:hypothetical protein [Ardenticatenia bacterium]